MFYYSGFEVRLHLIKFRPATSFFLHLWHPLRPLLKKNAKIDWSDELEYYFQNINNQEASITENTQYNPHLVTRIK